jgi:hypothetical protein
MIRLRHSIGLHLRQPNPLSTLQLRVSLRRARVSRRRASGQSQTRSSTQNYRSERSCGMSQRTSLQTGKTEFSFVFKMA